MLDIHEAQRRVIAVSRLPRERVPLSEAEGRVLAEALVAPDALPAFDYSAMDGYAVASASFAGSAPWELRVRGESRTGTPPEPLTPGCACRIFTGAELPSGADAVAPQEVVSVHDGVAQFTEPPAAWAHVRRRGEDLAAGAVALAEGSRLGAAQLALLASLDCAQVNVRRRPRVVIACTGDELRPVGSKPRPGSIPESNSIALASLCRKAAAEVRVAPLVADNAAETSARFDALLGECDVLITVGGASVGDYDLVRPALEAIGAQIHFHKLNIKPGKPVLFGSRGERHVLGLPGNPVSAQVTCMLLGLPLLRALQGDRAPLPRWRAERLLQPVRQKPGRHQFVRARLAEGGVIPLDNQASGATASSAWADALLHVPADSSGFAAGELAQVLSFAEA